MVNVGGVKGTPPRDQMPEYGQRSAGTHPTGMHSCLTVKMSWLLNQMGVKERCYCIQVCFISKG